MKSSPFLKLIARPWVDPVCLWGLSHIFPASRAWAAANISEGDLDRFKAELAVERVPAGLSPRIKRTAALRQTSDTAFERWNETVFGRAGDVTAVEERRRAAAHAWGGHRLTYLLAARRHGMPAVRLDVPTPDEVQREFAAAASDPDRFFHLPDPLPEVERSREADLDFAVEYWLRFPSPSGDTAYAHVYEPKHKPAGGFPTLIFGHGLAIETEMMKGDLKGYASLTAYGLRVILPDGPGHNRRVVPGLYGGESFIMSPPRSGLRHLSAAAKELGILAAWARGNGSNRVAFGGISLGALTAQTAAVRMGGWPAEARPDALMLLTTTDRVSSLALDSAIAVVAGLNVAAKAKGWEANSFLPLVAMVDAGPNPPIDPEHIVLLLGERDTVTPIDGGRRLAAGWRVPEKNLFRRDQGHFSAAFGLGVDPMPFRRIAEILAA
ncbi:alpha/beta hydrolase [Dongia sp.]|uniref:alpha/beta hydrolase n=1 Tax=Dongia sp. TaxID=1977262 RepID=UPI0037514651